MAASAETTVIRKAAKPKWRRWAKIILLSLVSLALLYQGYVVARVCWYRSHNPDVSALMAQRMAEARAAGEEPKRVQTWVPYDRISPNLVRAVLAGEDSRFV